MEDLPAPFVLAKGRDKLAEKLLTIARENNIEIVEQNKLVERLFMEDIGSFIPEEVYEVVAEIFAYVYAIQFGMRKR